MDLKGGRMERRGQVKGSPGHMEPPTSLSRTFRRELGDSNDNQGSYLVDENRNAYEPYSLAWRYLGMYIDCDPSGSRWYSQDDTERRKLENGSEDGDKCSRKILWAAYHDPSYSGGQIGEYQFLNWKENEWDESTCATGRCAKLNCHETWSRYELVGVFKETDGLYDWAEQLFKHEGYCVWDADKEAENEDGGGNDDNENDESDYEFMQNRLESWMGGDCTKMYLTDRSGNTLYLDTKPLPGGNMTYGLYVDEQCSQESAMTFSQYVVEYFSTYYDSEEKGYEMAEYWDGVFQRWNELMNAYKICQPCRAYSLVASVDDEDGDGNDDGNDDNENDGGGAAENSGYNCYDDAGYRNCNQCYKFETKTNLEPASHEDLQRASTQGTILSIRVGARFYGSGTFNSSRSLNLGLIGACLAFFVLFAGLLAGCSLIWNRFKRYRHSTEQTTTRRSILADISVGTSHTSLSGGRAQNRGQVRGALVRFFGKLSPGKVIATAMSSFKKDPPPFRLWTESGERS